MKIRDAAQRLPLERPPALEKRPSTQVKSIAQKQPSTFEEELQTSQKNELMQKIKIFLVEIDNEGQKLVRFRTMDLVRKYKELIKGFLKEVVQNLYLLKEERHFDPKGKHQALILVKTINKTLEDLVKMVLNKEVSNLKLLEKVGEIKGMLIDLYS